MKRVIRQSEIKRFKECRRSWMLGYHRALQPKQEFVKPGIRELGTLVHAGLEGWYRDATYPTDIVDQKWAEIPLEDQADNKANYELARIMLDGYIQHIQETGADVGYKIIDVERRIELPFGDILGDEIVITGAIDLEVEDAWGTPHFMDHKTVQSLDIGRQLQVDDQLLTYAVLRWLDSGVQIGSAIYNMLRKVKRSATAKPPFYDRIPITFNETQIRNHYSHMQGVLTDLVATAQRIEAGVDHQLIAYPNPGKDCVWRCDFISACAMCDDGSDVEGFLSTYFEPRAKLALSEENSD